MTLSDTMQALQAEFQAAERESAGFLFPWSLTFTLSGSTWDVSAEVVQPSPRDQGAFSLATGAAMSEGVAVQDIRLVYVSPDSTRPAAGAATPWDGGTLEILAWSQMDPLEGGKTGTAVLRR